MDVEIKTERLTLRPCRTEDGQRLRELIGVWDVAKMLARVPHPYPEGAAEQWIATHDDLISAGQEYIFAVDVDGLLAGVVGLHREGEAFELGYWLGVPYWGRGLMTEAAGAVVDAAFAALNCPRLVAGYFTENSRSARTLEKLGFEPTGRDIKYSLARNCDVAHVTLALTRSTWAAKSGIN